MLTRRGFSQTMAAPFAAPFLAAAASPQKAVIDKIEVFRVGVNQRGNWLIVRLTTADGITGVGDASHGGDERAIPLVKSFFERARGRSAFEVEPLRQALWPEVRKGRVSGAVAFGGIEQAMWDIQGKATGLPVWALFGGKLHPRIRNYANINRATDLRTPDGFAKLAERGLAAGFDHFKMASFDGMPPNGTPQQIEAHTQLGIDCIAAVRKTIGPDRQLLVDAHSNFSLNSGLELAQRLEPYNLYWLEEVTRGFKDLAEINKAAKMPTAGGESLFGTHGFLPYIEARAVDTLMPDIKYCGGLRRWARRRT
jgi:galactonate dehydratase